MHQIRQLIISVIGIVCILMYQAYKAFRVIRKAALPHVKMSLENSGAELVIPEPDTPRQA